MIAAIWVVVRAFLGGTFKALAGLASKVPARVWIGIAITVVAYLYHVSALRDERAEGVVAGKALMQEALDGVAGDLIAARAELLDAWTAAADAEGRDIAHLDALNQCIGERQRMDDITRAALARREQQRAAAVHALNLARQELDHAYATTADRCALQPVPDAVVRVLDLAAFGPSGSDANADDRSADPAAGARTVRADGADAGTGPTGTTYRDLAGWIADGWAPALASCNRDKAAIAELKPETEGAP